MTAWAKGAAGKVNNVASKEITEKLNHIGTTQKLNETKSSLNEAQQNEQAAGSQAEFIQSSMTSHDMDLIEANEQGFLNAEPVEEQTSKLNTNPAMSYVVTDGASRGVSLTQKFNSARTEQHNAGQEAEAAQSQVYRTQTGKGRVYTIKGVGRIGKAGVRPVYKGATFATKTGRAAMIDGVSGNSYLAHSMGRRVSQPMIGSGSPEQNQNHTLSEFRRVASGETSRSGEIDETGNIDISGER
ncbi:MAG: hypothetical protein J07HQW2_03820 [Haloquadratum walsbyi J07HQW2]|jgi:hypothetical protein|uniref:Uncharacterized protein n=2 Tax=Haloquadratum walsbyi TaxID=293091 RepID=U1N362_9EURY|nr:MAG: hypothetical protein J07HQW2_03820 [Haloquadratum walsbyi J07HQW2]